MYPQSLLVAPEATRASLVFDIPTEPAVLFIYLLLVIAGWLIWLGSRTSSDRSMKDIQQSDSDKAPPGPSTRGKRVLEKKKRKKEGRSSWTL